MHSQCSVSRSLTKVLVYAMYVTLCCVPITTVSQGNLVMIFLLLGDVLSDVDFLFICLYVVDCIDVTMHS